MITAVISTAIPLVLARALDLAEYGSYKQIFLIAQTLYLVLPFGMVQGLYYFVPRTERRRPLYGTTFAFLAVGAVLSVALVAFGADAAAHAFSNPDLVRFKWYIAMYLVGMLGSAPLEISLTAEGQTGRAACVYLVSDTLRAAVMVVPVLLGFGLTGVMVALAGFAGLRMAVSLVWLLRQSHGPLFERRVLNEQLRYAAPFGASVLLARPTQYLHQYAISALVAPQLFALYAVGCFQLPVVDLLYTPTSEVLMVQLGELEKQGRLERAAGVFRAAAGRLAYFFVPLSVLLFCVAPELIGALFGAKFLGATPIFRVSVLGILLSILPLDGALRSRNFTRHIFWAAVLKALVMLPLVYFGVRELGLMGGILSWAAGESFGKLALGFRLREALSPRDRRVAWREVIPWSELGISAVGAGGGAAAALLAKAGLIAVGLGPVGGFWHRALPLAIDSLAFGATYLCGLRILGVNPLSLLVKRRARAPVASPA